MVEHYTFNVGVLSSNLKQVTKFGMYISWLDCHPDKMEAVGSSPTMPTKKYIIILLIASLHSGSATEFGSVGGGPTPPEATFNGTLADVVYAHD